ncbi:MAG: hypothetical protein WKG01_32725 [Kofleriaceae bacterium]
MSDALSSMVEALRTRGRPDEDTADATRLRVRRSLQMRARARVRFVRTLVVAGIVLGATGAWALSTGRANALWHRIADEPAVDEPAHQISMRLDEAVRRRVAPAPRPAQLAVPEPVWAAVPESPTEPVPVPAPRPRVARPAIDPLYRRAHELHFHGTDHTATLAAWDAYLAAEPGGRFAVEAHYNRALVLVRLARYAEAHAALEPFARGEVAPAGYRQREATVLVERLSAIESVNE